MPEPHVVSGLVAKRAELSGVMLDYQKKIDQIRTAVVHLDASIKLFSPDYDLRSVRPKAHRQRNSYFRPGECQRLVLDIFRVSKDTALTSRQITEALIQRKGFADNDLIPKLQKTVIAILQRMVASRTLKEAGMDGAGRTWRLA